MTKSHWNFKNARKNTSLIFIGVLMFLAIASSTYYYLDSYRNQLQTINTNAQSIDLSAYCKNSSGQYDGVYHVPNEIDGHAFCSRAPWCGPIYDKLLAGQNPGSPSSTNGFDYDSVNVMNLMPPTACADGTGPQDNLAKKGLYPLCCYEIERTGDPQKCVGYWERKYCHPAQCRKIRKAQASCKNLNADQCLAQNPTACSGLTATACKVILDHGEEIGLSDYACGNAWPARGYKESDLATPVALSVRLSGAGVTPNLTPPSTPTPTPTFNPVDSVACPTTSTNSYISAPIATAESVGDRVPAEFHPDKNLLVRGYVQNDNNTMQVIDYTDPNRDTRAPQLTTLTDNQQPSIFHTYQVYDWNWGTPPNWGNKGALLINNPPKSYGVTALGLYGNPGSRVYVPNSGYTVNGGHQAYVIYASQDPVSSMGTMTLLYLSEDKVSGGYAVQLNNFCIDPKLLALYQQLSPPNKTNRNQLPVLDGRQPIGTYKTHELMVAIKDKGTYMDPRSIAWWQGVTALPPVPTAPPSTCPLPDDTAGLQAVRNGNNINLAWNPNASANKYTLWVDVKNKLDGTPDPWDGSCTSPAGDFCVDLSGTNTSTYTFAANPNQAYEWSIHAFNSCGQVKVQQGPYVPAVVNPPTATPTSSLPPGCLPINSLAGRDLVWSCTIGSFATANLIWQPVANATTYTVKIDNMTDPWDGSCTSPAGDTCVDVTTTSYSFDMRPGHTYSWSVQPKSGCTAGGTTTGATFRCAIPTGYSSPTPIPATGTPTATPTPANPPTNTPTPTPTPTVTPTPAPRFADCNKCGYCSTKTKQPGNYKECMKCLYPNMTEQDTLKVDPIKNQPPAPATGKYFSQLGCIDVGAAGFKDPSAAGGVVNVILNRLFFPITGVLALLSLIYGSFLLITGQDNPEQIARGKSWIYGGIIGVVFTFSAILIIRLIASDILKIPGFNM